MRNVFLAILLATASASAMAGWSRVSPGGSDTFYADSGSIIKSGHKVKMRALHDYQVAAKVAGVTFLSSEVQDEYDCVEKKARTLFYTLYSRRMAKGKKVYSDLDSHDWEPVKLGSAREILWNYACSKK